MGKVEARNPCGQCFPLARIREAVSLRATETGYASGTNLVRRREAHLLINARAHRLCWSQSIDNVKSRRSDWTNPAQRPIIPNRFTRPAARQMTRTQASRLIASSAPYDRDRMRGQPAAAAPFLQELPILLPDLALSSLATGAVDGGGDDEHNGPAEPTRTRES